ncbi:MAG: molybdenum ABC transporter ATP-binding protein, partial [Vicinamibacterales bacterium]
VLAQRPSVLLLDEPSSGIAQREAEALARSLRRVRDELGVPLVYVSHDLEEVAMLADWVIELECGSVVRSAATDHRRSPL